MKHVCPPLAGGDRWRRFGSDVDGIPPDAQDPREYEVMYEDHGRRNGMLAYHGELQAQGWNPEWWRLYKPPTLVAVKPALTGGTSSYYSVKIAEPAHHAPYTAECLDVIEALNMTFNEGEAFKAIWRVAAQRQGRGKPGNTEIYDCEKVVFYGQRMVTVAKRR